MTYGSNATARLPAPWRVVLCAAACFAIWPAHASFLEGEALDTVANVLAIVVLIIVPIVGITVFWLLHVMPEKIAHKRHHPQREAIHMLCILSLFFGGLLWPLAFLWAYSKPVLHKLAYGRDKHDDYYAEEEVAAVSIAPAAESERVRADVAQLRANVERLLVKGGTPQELAAIRDQLAALEPRIAAHAAPLPAQATEAH
jgi:CBS domain containing-hemolysin-like protein